MIPGSERFEAVDVFAGAGGWDMAARDLGLSVVGVEWDRATCDTRRAAGLATVQGDVRDHGPGTPFFEAVIRVVRALIGSPPCQPYSTTGSGAGRRALRIVLAAIRRMHATYRLRGVPVIDLAGVDDERVGLVLEPLRWALGALAAGRPFEWIALEQVPAVLPVWEAVAKVLRHEGYTVATGLLSSEWYGVPQTRKRAFLVASRVNVHLDLPAPTHRAYVPGAHRWAGGTPDLRAWETMGRALGWESPRVVVSNYGTGGDPARRGRRSWDEPAATVTSKFGRNRIWTPEGFELPRLTASQAGVLQGFPADHPWTGTATEVAEQVGNAVPVGLARAVLGVTAR